MDSLLVISCIFGDKFKYVHQSPDIKNSFFFTNNPMIKTEITNKGWNYVYVDKPISDDDIISSLQSKYIKFLAFLKDFPEFKNKKTIIYFDHKENVSSSTLNEISLLINNNLDKSLIIRQTPTNKTKISDEINAAMGQSRYVKNMNKTKDFVQLMISSGSISENVRICNTGLLIYIDRYNIEDLLMNVYDKCIEHAQPECQIYWSIFSQKYKNEIKEINWTDIKNIKRYDPPVSLFNLEDSFDQIYKNKMWTGNGKFTLSGPGSELIYTTETVKFLINFIEKRNIKKIIDGSCGDCTWIMEVLKMYPDIEYIGYDISQEIININIKKYNKYSFYKKNLLDLNEIPECDLFIVRHTMMHLSIKDNIELINTFKNKSNCYVLLTHHEVKENKEGNLHGQNFSSLKWEPKNLHIKPFDIEKFLIEKFKENTNNSNEFGCIYKFI